MKDKLQHLRKRIDGIDTRLVRLLNDRTKAAVEIGRLKHAAGEEITTGSELGLWLYPKGQEPKKRSYLIGFTGLKNGPGALDIPPNQVSHTEGFTALKENTIITNFQPHFHLRGKSMLVEAILPTGATQVISYVQDFNFNWMTNYIYDDDAAIFPNMYWYYGQQDMKGLERVRAVPNLYATWISNFSCAPDSFMLHYLRWMMGRKPYLVLEIDSHTADAGLDTRIEAFLDIVDSFRREAPPAPAIAPMANAATRRDRLTRSPRRRAPGRRHRRARPTGPAKWPAPACRAGPRGPGPHRRLPG